MAAEEAMAMTMTYEIVSRDVPTQRVATIRERVQMTAIGQAMGDGFGEIAQAVEAAGAEIDGLPFAIYHEIGPDEAEVEMGFPVLGNVELGRVHSATLDGGHMACTVHMGA